MVFFMMLKRQSFKNLWEYVGVAELENYLFILGKVWGFHHPTPKIIAYKSRGELFLWDRATIFFLIRSILFLYYEESLVHIIKFEFKTIYSLCQT